MAAETSRYLVLSHSNSFSSLSSENISIPFKRNTPEATQNSLAPYTLPFWFFTNRHQVQYAYCPFLGSTFTIPNCWIIFQKNQLFPSFKRFIICFDYLYIIFLYHRSLMVIVLQVPHPRIRWYPQLVMLPQPFSRGPPHPTWAWGEKLLFSPKEHHYPKRKLRLLWYVRDSY